MKTKMGVIGRILFYLFERCPKCRKKLIKQGYPKFEGFYAVQDFKECECGWSLTKTFK